MLERLFYLDLGKMISFSGKRLFFLKHNINFTQNI